MARALAGIVALVLGAVSYALIVPRFTELDRWLAAEGCKPTSWLEADGGPCAPSWRPLVFFCVVGVVVLSWATFRVAAYPWARRRLATRMQRARALGSLHALLCDEASRIERLERGSAAIPLLGVALLGPFAVHSFVVPGLGLGVFDSWMSVLGATALPAQVALMGFTILDTKRWTSSSLRALERDDSWKRAFWLVVVSAAVTTLAFQVANSSVRSHFGHWLFVVGAGVIASVTFMLSWPLVHNLVRAWIVRERSELMSVSTLLERVADEVRVAELDVAEPVGDVSTQSGSHGPSK